MTQLRERFAELRRADRLRTPDFTESWNAARSRLVDTGSSSASRWAAATALVATAATATLLLMLGSRPDPAPDLACWRAPSDILLQVPGTEAFHTVPDLEPRIPRYDLDPNGGEPATTGMPRGG